MIIIVEVVITPIRKVWKPASRIIKSSKVVDNSNEVLLTNDEIKKLHEEFAKWLSDIIVHDIKSTISTQRYLRKWKPLSKSYLDYKRSHGLSTNIWECTSHLLKSIKSYKRHGRWYIGLSNYQLYPDTKIKVLDVARYMEYGTSRMPARPLFRPIFNHFNNNIRKYWIEFLNYKGYRLER